MKGEALWPHPSLEWNFQAMNKLKQSFITPALIRFQSYQCDHFLSFYKGLAFYLNVILSPNE